MAPTDELRQLCYGGEELVETAAIRNGAIGITSHRVLVLTPDGPGARFQAVDRPNVRRVEAVTSGPTAARDRALRAGIVAGAFLIAGAVVDLGGIVQPVSPPDGMGLGGLLGLVDAVVMALGLLDEALLVLGLLSLLVALGSLAWYLRARDPVIEIEVAGGDALRVPISREETAVADRLRAALADEQAPDATLGLEAESTPA